ncbi:hypothetical protein L9F63_015286, partial [Diploptera punctata]
LPLPVRNERYLRKLTSLTRISFLQSYFVVLFANSHSKSNASLLTPNSNRKKLLGFIFNFRSNRICNFEIPRNDITQLPTSERKFFVSVEAYEL